MQYRRTSHHPAGRESLTEWLANREKPRRHARPKTTTGSPGAIMISAIVAAILLLGLIVAIAWKTDKEERRLGVGLITGSVTSAAAKTQTAPIPSPGMRAPDDIKEDPVVTGRPPRSIAERQAMAQHFFYRHGMIYRSLEIWLGQENDERFKLLIEAQIKMQVHTCQQWVKNFNILIANTRDSRGYQPINANQCTPAKQE